MEDIEYIDVLNQNGEFTGIVESREKCHKEGLWHRANYCFVFNKDNDVLLQRRSGNKKLWPNLWDVTAGGHVLAGEFGVNALIRELKEELGIDIEEKDLRYLVGSTSVNNMAGLINKHFNECFIVTKNIDINDIVLQKEEVSDIRWFTKDEILSKINNQCNELTDKTGVWNFLKRYYESK